MANNSLDEATKNVKRDISISNGKSEIQNATGNKKKNPECNLSKPRTQDGFLRMKTWAFFHVKTRRTYPDSGIVDRDSVTLGHIGQKKTGYVPWKRARQRGDEVCTTRLDYTNVNVTLPQFKIILMLIFIG